MYLNPPQPVYVCPIYLTVPNTLEFLTLESATKNVDEQCDYNFGSKILHDLQMWSKIS